jgi:hypothetical protein
MPAEVPEIAHKAFKREVLWNRNRLSLSKPNFSQLPVPGFLKAFIWTATASDILAKVTRARRALDKMESA